MKRLDLRKGDLFFRGYVKEQISEVPVSTKGDTKETIEKFFRNIRSQAVGTSFEYLQQPFT